MGKFGKAIAAVLVLALVALRAKLSGDNNIEADEWVAVATVAVGALGTYLVPLAPEMRWGKTAVFALLAALDVLAVVILGGIEPGEWIDIVIAIGGALGVAVMPAVSDNAVAAKSGLGD